MKILKYLILFTLTAIFGIIIYVYSLTFTPNGRLDWGQVVFLKMVGSTEGQVDQLKKMTVAERSHMIDSVPIDIKGFAIDTLKITKDSVTIYVFKPKNLPANSPVVVYYHGGGFVLPWTNLSVGYATRLARKLNAVVVAVDYRVAPEHPYPAPNDDCFATLLWTIDNVAKWGGNPNQIVLAGESAGATLATAVALKAKSQRLPNVKYQILECPAAYLPFETASYPKLSKGYFLEDPGMRYSMVSYLPNPADHTNPQVLAFYSDSLSNMPPAFVVTCEFDPIKDTGLDYVQKLKKAQVPTVHKEMEGMTHCIPGPFNEGDREKLYEEIAQEAKKYLTVQ